VLGHDLILSLLPGQTPLGEEEAALAVFQLGEWESGHEAADAHGRLATVTTRLARISLIRRNDSQLRRGLQRRQSDHVDLGLLGLA